MRSRSRYTHDDRPPDRDGAGVLSVSAGSPRAPLGPRLSCTAPPFLLLLLLLLVVLVVVVVVVVV